MIVRHLISCVLTDTFPLPRNYFSVRIRTKPSFESACNRFWTMLHIMISLGKNQTRQPAVWRVLTDFSCWCCKPGLAIRRRQIGTRKHTASAINIYWSWFNLKIRCAPFRQNDIAYKRHPTDVGRKFEQGKPCGLSTRIQYEVNSASSINVKMNESGWTNGGRRTENEPVRF